MLTMLAAAAAATPMCGQVPLPKMIDSYAAMILHQDNAGIARLFGADGVIENPGAAPIRGEAAIARMLSSFKGVAVKSETLTVGDVVADAEGWRVTGKFHQTGRTPDGKDYDVGGSFDSSWTCGPDGWRVRRMATGK